MVYVKLWPVGALLSSAISWLTGKWFIVDFFFPPTYAAPKWTQMLWSSTPPFLIFSLPGLVAKYNVINCAFPVRLFVFLFCISGIGSNTFITVLWNLWCCFNLELLQKLGTWVAQFDFCLTFSCLSLSYFYHTEITCANGLDIFWI